MISLPRRAATPLFFLAIALAGCDQQPTAPGFASVAGSLANSNKKDKDPDVSARVLVDANGVATLEVRTGVWNDAATVGAYDGYFKKIQYKVYDERGKQILERNIEFKKVVGTYLYSEVVSLCKAKRDDDDDECDHGHEWRRGYDRDWDADDDRDNKHGRDRHSVPKPPKPPCDQPFKAGYTVVVKALVKGFEVDEKRTAEARDDASIIIGGGSGGGGTGATDLAITPVKMVIPGPPPFLADPGLVEVNKTQTFDVQFSNNVTNGITTGLSATCEVHVFSGTTEVTAPGLTFTWLPNGQAAVGATVPGSKISAPLVIPAGNVAACRFTLTMATTGTFQVVVTGNAVTPADANLANNKTTGTIEVVSGTPVTPPPSDGGAGRNATADDHAFFGPTYVLFGPYSRFTDFLGDSAQRANIENLSSTIITNGGLQGTFTLAVNFYTLDTLGGSLAHPLATRTLSKATWTGSLPDIVAAASTAPLHCVSSDVFGTMTVSAAANGNHLEALMCVEAGAGSQLNVGLTLKWRPPSEPPVFRTAASGAQYYGDLLYWDTDLKFSNLAQNPVSHALVPLGYLALPLPNTNNQCAGGPVGAFACVLRSL